MSTPDSEFDINIARPKGWKDRSVYVYEGRKGDKLSGYRPTITVTKTSLALTEKFQKFVQEEVKRYKTEMTEFSLLHSREGKMNGLAGHDIMFTWRPEGAGPDPDEDDEEPIDPDTGIIKQRVIMLKASSRQAITFTSSAALNDYADHETAFNTALASLTV